MGNGVQTVGPDLHAVQLGPWVIDVAARQVTGPSGSARLEPKAMGVLVELASQPGQVVARQQLLERVWGPEMATDDVLSRAISELRRALGDDSRNPQFIVTVRGAGYRLVVPDSAGHDGLPASTAAPASDGRSWTLRVTAFVAVGAAIAAILPLVVVLRSAESSGSDSATSIATPLTSRPGQESAPRLSPDGTRIAYAWRGELPETQQIYVRLVDGGRDLRVTSGAGDYQFPAWSPDGARLAVTRTEGSSLGIYALSSLGGDERLITRVAGPYILGLDWASDGRRLVYAALDSGTMAFGIRVHDLESGREQRLTAGAAEAFGDVYATFSPDGRVVAFVRFYSEVAADLYVIPATGGTPRRLTTDERAIGAIAFARDGQSLLYSANRDGRTSVWRVSVDGSTSKPSRVYESARGITGLAALPSETGVVVAESDVDLDVWLAPTSGSQAPRSLAPSTRVDALPRYSPDGARVAFVSERSGQPELWVADTSGENVVRLTTIGSVRGLPAWSPNGDAIAVERGAGTGSELWIVDPARQNATRVPLALRDALAPSWSPDGRSLYVSSRQNGRWDVFRVAVEDGTFEQITTAGGMGARATADGQSIVYAKPYARGLWRLDLMTKVESRIATALGAGDCTNWDLVGDILYFVDRDTDGRQSIRSAPLGGGRPNTVVRNVRVPVGSGGLSVAPDGRSVLYGQIGRRDGDLMIVAPQR
jgi:Tol biopolymer transport system component/DNA-binding winged helix-turn-helix (wHTH) protein